jgi:hypothetical protein
MGGISPCFSNVKKNSHLLPMMIDGRPDFSTPENFALQNFLRGK